MVKKFSEIMLKEYYNQSVLEELGCIAAMPYAAHLKPFGESQKR